MKTSCIFLTLAHTGFMLLLIQQAQTAALRDHPTVLTSSDNNEADHRNSAAEESIYSSHLLKMLNKAKGIENDTVEAKTMPAAASPDFPGFQRKTRSWRLNLQGIMPPWAELCIAYGICN